MGKFDLSELGVTSEEVLQSIEEFAPGSGIKVRDGRICACGHGISRHNTEDVNPKNHFCAPAKMFCACKEIRPIMKVSHTTFFLRKSDGNGKNHALVRGLVKANEELENFEYEWLIPAKCELCNEPTGYYPTFMTEGGSLTEVESERTRFACQDCRNKQNIL